MTYETNTSATTHSFVPEKIGGYEVFDEFFFHNFSQILSKEISSLEKKVGVLKNHAVTADSEILEETFAMIECSVEGVHNFVAELNLLGRNGRGRRRLKPQSIRIRSVVDKVKKELRSDYLKTVRLHEQIDGNCVVFGDSKKLFFVIKNLLSNALKFSREDVYLSIEPLPDELLIVVRDFGIGIPERDLESVFLPFYRCENARLMSGTGIGLTVVKKLLDEIGGKIVICSELKKGTEVVVSFPVRIEGQIDRERNMIIY